MATTIPVTSEIKKELATLKARGDHRTYSELLADMIAQYRLQRFLATSREFRKEMDKRKLKPGDLS